MRDLRSTGRRIFRGSGNRLLLMIVNVEQCSTELQAEISFFLLDGLSKCSTLTYMAKQASLPVRLDTETAFRVDAAVKRLGITKSALIRMLLQSFVDQFEQNGGKIVMPPTWKASTKGK